MKKKIIFCAFLLFGQNFLLIGQVKTVFKTGKIPPLKTAVQPLFLAGDFNNWNSFDKAWELLPDSSGSYHLVKDLPNGTYNFKVTRGSWQTVECNKFGKSVDNRSINIKNDATVIINIDEWQDDFPTAEKQHTAGPQVHIISEKFDMPQLDRQRKVWIYLPADYQFENRKYPVIYMHDGQNLFDAYTSGYGEWGIDEILDKLPAKKQCIVVGIDHGDEYRITEYDPYDSKYGKGRGGDYVDFLVKTLKPYIDQHYRTKPDAGHTIIAGSSMGGLISMYAVLKYPDVFGNAGIFSPAFWIAPQIYDYALKAHLSVDNKFYFVCGNNENKGEVADMQKMVDIIRFKGIDEKKSPVTIINGGEHNEKQWNGDFPAFYKWLERFW
jgi:predicted alpha/beta superfamily hydrolase